MIRTRSVLFILGTCAVFCVGCGPKGPPIGSVTGTITMDGQPLANATVIFMAESGGRPAAAKTDAEGKYELNFSAGRKGAILGPNKVRITTLNDPYEDEDGNPVPGTPETIALEYNQQTTLSFDVKEDEANVANFDLKSGGRIMKGDEGDS